MKMCKWCHRIWADDLLECKCGSEDFANINEDWIREKAEEDMIRQWEKKNSATV